MNEVLEQIQHHRIVPVVSIHAADAADALADALEEGGLPCAEITFRTQAAEKSIHILAKRRNFVLGAGTVLSIDQVKTAVDAGAKFIVSPGFNPKVVQYCVDNHVPVTPGISNPTDIEMALEHGIDVVKFFPAEAFGGLATLKAMSAPYGMMRFIPTGGINAQNVLDYLHFAKVLACGGSWMVKSDLISQGAFDKIAQLTREAVDLVKSMKKQERSA